MIVPDAEWKPLTFLEVRRLLKGPLPAGSQDVLVAGSGNLAALEEFIRATSLAKGLGLSVHFLPFNTLGQHLRTPKHSSEREVLFLAPWDFVPEADWRSGIPAASDRQSVRVQAETVAAAIADRKPRSVVYLSAPIPPVMPTASENAALQAWMESLAISLGATVLPPGSFSLSNYLASGCPVAGAWLGRVAVFLVQGLTTSTPDPKKLLVTDLDNVMWNGVIGEDGPEGILYGPLEAGYPHFIYQTLLKRLRQEGVLLAVVSRNDADLAWNPFRGRQMVLGEDDLVGLVASYHPKSAQIRELVQRLSLGLDSIVFIDDNPVELAEVASALPQVTCLTFPSSADEFPGLALKVSRLFPRGVVTTEDRERTALYRRRLEGLAPSEVAGGDLEAFLLGLDMELSIHDRTHANGSRAVQLINKTNQFNLNGMRLSEAEVEATLAGGGQLLSASLRDRAGDHGEILACLVDPDRTISAFVMSCRVLQRRVEHAFFAWLLSHSAPPTRMIYKRTERNEPLRQFLIQLFQQLPADGYLSLGDPTLADRLGKAGGVVKVTET